MPEPEPAPVDARDPDWHGPPRAPRWVRVTGIVAAVVVLVVILVLLLGGGPGGHGPGRH